ncbi:single-stranded DNA-binding protein [Nonomuraea dietziae]|uniref:Single-stranded DNA-binding protein n=1 Tax=Nonomuraea dietziae TaxID=65515 RepID=A0A7W5VI65_9ACTN|nr:single-stranded DNA-binding protein [Nonomuraea dietziae]MBB3734045.1 single-strand DNA-binding protein [Nonomuraea dietziae]
MAFETAITVTGNLVDDPDLRFISPSGHAVLRFRIASNPRFQDRDTHEWKDGDPLFLTCNLWRRPAENAAETLQRGMRVIVHGRLKQRSYETEEGDKRTIYEVEVDEIGPSLRNATATIAKNRSDRDPGTQEWQNATRTRPEPTPEAAEPAPPAPALALVPGSATSPADDPRADGIEHAAHRMAG